MARFRLEYWEELTGPCCLIESAGGPADYSPVMNEFVTYVRAQIDDWRLRRHADMLAADIGLNPDGSLIELPAAQGNEAAST